MGTLLGIMSHSSSHKFVMADFEFKYPKPGWPEEPDPRFLDAYGKQYPPSTMISAPVSGQQWSTQKCMISYLWCRKRRPKQDTGMPPSTRVPLLPFPLESYPSRYLSSALERSLRSRWPCSREIQCWLERTLPILLRAIYLVLQSASARMAEEMKMGPELT